MTGQAAETPVPPPDWYEVVSSRELRQGDVFIEMPVRFISEACNLRDPDADTNFDEIVGNWIILTPSCDMQWGKVPQALLALCRPATAGELKVSEKDLPMRREVIRRGFEQGKFLLPRSLHLEFPLSFIDFRISGMLPLSLIRSFVGNDSRLRLRHPFREKMASAGAQWLTNIGYEDDVKIPDFVKKGPTPSQLLIALPDPDSGKKDLAQ